MPRRRRARSGGARTSGDLRIKRRAGTDGSYQIVEEITADLMASLATAACSGSSPVPRRSCCWRRRASVEDGEGVLVRENAHGQVRVMRTDARRVRRAHRLRTRSPLAGDRRNTAAGGADSGELLRRPGGAI